MRLKRLEIKGFKSFADETVIHFNEAVTGIVGPNGSGKSNIVDAIRWVLGEQKGRELRLAAMSDVIFNGTKKRKPAPVSHVTLHFENTKNLLPTDYQNIEISRLLYRSGESEYRLNGVTCRLKDITSLFLDTGVGSDSYAIIALGMVEDILANKENARRKMFEQAAGISKYKARKKESINKLKATNEDLARIEDLLFEINNNLNELEKQAKRAKKFFEMRDKYRSTAMLLYHISVSSIREKLEKLTESITIKSDELNAEEVVLKTKEANLEEFKLSNLDKEKHLGDFQKKVNDILDKIRVTESNIQVKDQKKILLETQITHLDSLVQSAVARISSLEGELQDLESEIGAIQSDFNNVKDESQKNESIYQSKQKEFEDLKSGVDQFHQKKLKVEQEIYSIEKSIAIQSNQIDNLKSENIRLKQELESKEIDFKSVETEINSSDSRLQSIQAKISELQREETLRQEAIQGLQKQIESQTQKIAQCNRSKDAKKNEYDLLKSMIDKMEGFPESIVFLNQTWRSDIPLLSDLIYTEERYRNAIEMFLEPFLNYYVVRTEEDAVHAIKLLFSNGKGKANFFILDKFKKIQSKNPSIQSCKLATELIETDELYRPLFDKLLDSVYILDESRPIDDAIKFPDEISIISLSGSILKQKTTISGGSVGLFEGKKLGRKKNLEKLETEIKKLELELIELDRTFTDQKNNLKKLELENKQVELNQLRKQETDCIAEQAKFNTTRAHFIEVSSQLKKRIEDQTSQQTALGTLIEQANDQLLKLKQEQSKLIQTISDKDEVFGKVSLELSHATNLFNQTKLEVLKWQNKYDNIAKDIAFKQQQFSELKTKQTEDQNKIGQYSEEILEIKQFLEAERDVLRQHYEDKKAMESDLSSLEKAYYDARNTIVNFENEIKASQRIISDFQSSINSLKDQKTEFNFKIQSAYEKAELEFGMKLDEFVPDQETDGMDELQLQDRAQYYKVRLDNYGEINPMALEAYDEMKKRYDTIQEQRADIIKAQEKLLETIKEIEATATAGFMMAFNQVRTHFQDVFRSLFTLDDDCDLILMDENDPLECEIDIIAKPKGKRPKSIHQLSGGEKTLTAIALLFSLYLLKPAPFCIFDEVDAPLDDINIEKFNQIIRKFSKESQFIIITHNKLTMAEVDVLYGVYMEEQGISNVTAVDFRKYNHELVLDEMEG